MENLLKGTSPQKGEITPNQPFLPWVIPFLAEFFT